MKLHRNAKTTPVTRRILVQRVLEHGWTYAQAAQSFAVSERTVRKWVRRYRETGVAGLEDGSSRPARAAHQTAAAVVAQIAQLRREQQLPAWRISRLVGIPRSTVGAWLRRLGMSRPPRAVRPPVQRYEWPRPGDLLHVDIKPLGRFRRVGHRVSHDPRHASRGAGWEYAHVAIDDHSRVAYVEVLPAQGGEACAAFLRRALAWFAAQGVTCTRVLSDNGAGYRSRAFREVATAHGVALRRTRPYTPRTNGKAERFIQTLLREWAYATAYPTSTRRQHALAPWLAYYNSQRPHTSLRYEPPITRLQNAA